MQNIMVDIETLSTDTDAAIIAIGAVAFDKDGIGDAFYTGVNLQSCMDLGRSMDAATISWWMEQSNNARSLLFRKAQDGSPPLADALAAFATWMRGQSDDPVVWGNGAAFDNTILSNAYAMTGIEQPWEFWNDRCYRTVKSMYPDVSIERAGIYHNALDDARSQALHLLAIAARYNLGSLL